MLSIDSRVYHKGIKANGVVVDIDATKRNQYKVRFFWAKYCDVLHGEWKERMRTGTKWQWCDGENLIETALSEPINKVTSIGGRSLDRLIRNVCEFDRRQRDDGSDIVMVYGQSNHQIPDEMLVLNRDIVINKMLQCQQMGEYLAPRSAKGIIGDNAGWIIKPFQSMGGRGIRRFYDDETVGYRHLPSC